MNIYYSRNVDEFDPWVGGEFDVAPLKLLIVGDSHYDQDQALRYHSNFTIDVVQKYIENSPGTHGHRRWHVPFTRTSQVIAGQGRCQFDRREVWSHLAFFNFFSGVTIDPNDQSRQSINDDLARCRRIVCQLGPQILFVWGKKVFDCLQSVGASNLQETGCQFAYRWHEDVWVFRSKHPSRAYSFDEWSKNFEKFIHAAALEDGCRALRSQMRRQVL